MPSGTVATNIVAILVIALPWFGVQFDSTQLTGLVQAVVLIGTALWNWYSHVNTQKELGRNVNFLGGVKR